MWEEIEAPLDHHAVSAPTRAFTDLFDTERPALDRIREPIRALDRQLGAVAEIAGEPVALDLVGRPDVFADLLPRLADGYALQALERHRTIDGPHARADDDAAEEFLEQVLRSRRRWVTTPGMGHAFVPTRQGITGCGLRAEPELVALSAFPTRRG